MTGFEAAFKGAMNAYGILAHNAVSWLQNVTGSGGNSEPHYWPAECETCKEIAKFIEDWSPTTYEVNIVARNPTEQDMLDNGELLDVLRGRMDE